MLEKFVEDCLLWVGPLAGAGEESEEEGAAERTCHELTATPIPHPPALLVHKKLGRGTAKIADPNWPKGYSIPCDIMPTLRVSMPVQPTSTVTGVISSCGRIKGCMALTRPSTLQEDAVLESNSINRRKGLIPHYTPKRSAEKAGYSQRKAQEGSANRTKAPKGAAAPRHLALLFAKFTTECATSLLQAAREPITCIAYCLLVLPEGHGAELVCAKELLSPMTVALGKMLQLSTQCTVEQQYSSDRLTVERDMGLHVLTTSIRKREQDTAMRLLVAKGLEMARNVGLASALHADNDAIWYGIALWSDGVSCPGCVPSQLLVPPPAYSLVGWAEMREDERAGPSQGEEEEEEELINETETTRSLCLSELRDMQKYFSRCPGKHVVTWLLQCWDNGASSLELEGKEAKQLGSLSREGGIDKAIGKGAPVLSLCRQLLSAMKERYPFKEDVVYHPRKWTTMERGIQYLRELAVLEVIYGDLDNEQLSKDPDEVQCTRPGWRLNHFPGQPVPMLDNPFREVKFPNIQSKPPLAQLEAISSRPITHYLGEETDPHLSTTSFQGWRLNHFPGQSVPMLDNPLGEVKFPHIQSKPPLAQLEAISSCPITCYLGEETDPHLSTTSFQVVVESDEVSPQPPFLQAKQSQLPQPLLIRLLLQTLHQLRCPSLYALQYLNIPLVVGGPKLNTVFEVRPHQCRVQGHNHFPSPAGHAIFDTGQDAIGLLGRLGTLLAHIQAAVNQHPQVLLCQAAFQPLFPKPVALHGVAVAQVQDLALGLVKPHTIHPSPSIQPVQVPLQSLPPLKQINTPT
ncbi:hypothetical protein QYF61_020019 [Mycteria americana]|uniref:Uncharacterized protein n=1 Tax=Mycteria americana TaxID=33587 RepID=A0AAN7P2N7_MYCAM|nr:hypothetical protein QYF61_020019 [Mycteria americana]